VAGRTSPAKAISLCDIRSAAPPPRHIIGILGIKQRGRKPVAKLLDRICSILAVISALLLLFITFSIGYSIFTRLLRIPSPFWIVQFNEYSLLWMTFLGTAWVLSVDKHVSINIIVQRLGVKTQKYVGIFNSLLGMGLCAVLCGYGIFTTRETFVRGVIDVQSIDVPKAFVLVIIPLGFLFTFLKFIHRIVLILKD
jgi:TRAP-type C4-dicarboxylate transport system permease small subunit